MWIIFYKNYFESVLANLKLCRSLTEFIKTVIRWKRTIKLQYLFSPTKKTTSTERKRRIWWFTRRSVSCLDNKGASVIPIKMKTTTRVLYICWSQLTYLHETNTIWSKLKARAFFTFKFLLNIQSTFILYNIRMKAQFLMKRLFSQLKAHTSQNSIISQIFNLYLKRTNQSKQHTV